MKIIKWIKRKLGRCDDCWRTAIYHFEYPPMSEEDEGKDYLNVKFCYNHALKSGFCLGCGGFFAGVESFDFSDAEGFCSDCIDEINWDLGIGEEMGDTDYYDDYDHDFEVKQPQEAK